MFDVDFSNDMNDVYYVGLNTIGNHNPKTAFIFLTSFIPLSTKPEQATKSMRIDICGIDIFYRWKWSQTVKYIQN